MLHDIEFEKHLWRNGLSGGTMKFRLILSEDRWLKCNKCDEFFKKHYYVHQCDPYHLFCNKCLIDKKKCTNCNTSFVKLLKIKC